MGGVATPFRKAGTFSNINPMNPASYANIGLTTIDVGLQLNYVGLKRNALSDQGFGGALSHVAFAVPVSKRSAISFGLLPYTSVGYNYKNSTRIDTNTTNFIYSGEGGISKAYVGYGFGVGNLSIGGNVSYLFGDIKEFRSTEFPNLPGAYNSRFEDNKSVYGFSFDYGLQYAISLSDKNKLVVAYSGTAASQINSKNSIVASRYTKNFSTGDENNATDTTFFVDNAPQKIKLPYINRVGLSFESTEKLLIGAEYRMGQWANFSEGGVNGGLKNTMGAALGAQFTPNANAVSGYFQLVEYRVGVNYDKLYYNVSNTDIKQYGVTLGFGLPLMSGITSRNKINLTFEYGQRGTLQNNLLKENYFNINLGFLLNDKWFIKRQFD